ncbi:Glucosamine-6-phosphate deaminase [Spironucleus salmonicida]|uniref:glucosamine-6-phosphate deaminase n=1 Tax=Spironucleus salmonicida TaxID=348837 RepID=A0A9P8LKW5_9EUKA|nr:Glucosamine-6-phosphate deaminase [Spironucleus salmonicida]
MPACRNISAQPALEVAREIAAVIRAKPDAVLGLATGSTPIPVYQELARMHREEGLDFSSVRSINLDEYYGLSGDHPQSYRHFMHEHLFRHVNIRRCNTHFLDGSVPQDCIDRECDRYEALVSSCPPDIWLLGIGLNGHIAFNEPGSACESRTRFVSLTPSTIEANRRFFGVDEQVPTSSLTVGISTILKARKLVLLATGDAKKCAVDAAFASVSSDCPASFLQGTDCGFWVDFE